MTIHCLNARCKVPAFFAKFLRLRAPRIQWMRQDIRDATSSGPFRAHSCTGAIPLIPPVPRTETTESHRATEDATRGVWKGRAGKGRTIVLTTCPCLLVAVLQERRASFPTTILMHAYVLTCLCACLKPCEPVVSCLLSAEAKGARTTRLDLELSSESAVRTPLLLRALEGPRNPRIPRTIRAPHRSTE